MRIGRAPSCPRPRGAVSVSHQLLVIFGLFGGLLLAPPKPCSAATVTVTTTTTTTTTAAETGSDELNHRSSSSSSSLTDLTLLIPSSSSWPLPSSSSSSPEESSSSSSSPLPSPPPCVPFHCDAEQCYDSVNCSCDYDEGLTWNGSSCVILPGYPCRSQGQGHGQRHVDDDLECAAQAHCSPLLGQCECLAGYSLASVQEDSVCLLALGSECDGTWPCNNLQGLSCQLKDRRPWAFRPQMTCQCDGGQDAYWAEDLQSCRTPVPPVIVDHRDSDSPQESPRPRPRPRPRRPPPPPPVFVVLHPRRTSVSAEGSRQSTPHSALVSISPGLLVWRWLWRLRCCSSGGQW